MSPSGAIRGAILPQHADRIGFYAIVAFLLLTSLRDIYLSSVFRTFSPVHVAILSFALSGVFFLPVTVARHRDQLRLLWVHRWESLLMNGACAVSWIAYFYALKDLDPALAQMVCAGMGPITADLAARRDDNSAGSGHTERTLHVCIVASLLVGVLLQIVDLSSTDGGPSAVLCGAGMALVSGVTLAIYRISCKRLNDKGITAGTILGVRSPIIALAATAVAWTTSDTDAAMWSATSLATVSAACIALIVVPIYVNQVGVALASPITAGVAGALQPTLLFGMQVVLGTQKSHSAYSLGSVLVYSIFAITSTLVRRTGSTGQQPAMASARAATA